MNNLKTLKKIIVPSIIAKSQRELNERISKIKGAKLLQLDVMDGKFVRNNSLDFDFKIPKKFKYEAHLMVKRPELWIEKNYKKIHVIIFHLESCKNSREVRKIIDLIKSKKRGVGIAINPKTSVTKIKPFLKEIDMVIVMSVNPGKYGAKFLPDALKKVKVLRRLNSRMNIEVDGGINDKTIKKAKDAGANQFVVGSYLQKSEDFGESFGELRERI